MHVLYFADDVAFQISRFLVRRLALTCSDAQNVQWWTKMCSDERRFQYWWTKKK